MPPALGIYMRKTLLVALLLAAVACGSYRFPSQPAGGTGTLSGKVTSVGCGLVKSPTAMCCPANAMCLAPKPIACGAVPADTVCATPYPQPIICPPGGPKNNVCGGPVPVPGLELDLTSGSTTLSTTTDSAGNYSIELPAGTWNVTTKNFLQIVGGPTTVTITAGASIVANYTVWSRIAALS